MDLLMNGLLLAGTCFAGAYCWVLARRVRDLKSLDSGLGGAIVTLTRQVELARTTLEEARSSSRDTKLELAQLVQRAEAAAGQLRLLIAAAPAPGRLQPARAAPIEAPEPLRAESRAAVPQRTSAITPLPCEQPQEPARAPEPEAASQLRLGPRPRAVVPPSHEPVGETPKSALATPVAIPTLDRLVAGPLGVSRPRPADPEAARPAAPHLTEVPKPRALAPVENPLRRLRVTQKSAPTPAPEESAAGLDGSEDAILEALSALAGGR